MKMWLSLTSKVAGHNNLKKHINSLTLASPNEAVDFDMVLIFGSHGFGVEGALVAPRLDRGVQKTPKSLDSAIKSRNDDQQTPRHHPA